MTDTSVGLGGVAASLVLVVVAVVLSLRQGLGVERTIAWAATRAFVQLLIVCSALAVVLDDEAPVALALLWVVVMVLIAAYTISCRSKLVPRLFLAGLLAAGPAARSSPLESF